MSTTETELQNARDREQRPWNDAELQIQNRYNVLAYWDKHVDPIRFYGPAFWESRAERQAREAVR